MCQSLHTSSFTWHTLHKSNLHLPGEILHRLFLLASRSDQSCFLRFQAVHNKKTILFGKNFQSLFCRIPGFQFHRHWLQKSVVVEPFPSQPLQLLCLGVKTVEGPRAFADFDLRAKPPFASRLGNWPQGWLFVLFEVCKRVPTHLPWSCCFLCCVTFLVLWPPFGATHSWSGWF